MFVRRLDMASGSGSPSSDSRLLDISSFSSDNYALSVYPSCGVRKRAKLDFLTEEEKTIRRKLLNREAAQKARDRKKDSIKAMEQCIQQLQAENRSLRQTVSSLRDKCRDHEVKFITMRKEFTSLTEALKTRKRKQIEPSESAALAPQQQGLALCILLLFYLPLISTISEFLCPMKVMITILFSQTVPLP